ncbi:YbdK family carboxylate-amine ligase [Aeromicrobium sp. Marseille-Q0843]|uniref:Putative glutamate--cysteine ligase 2 n=1 Tax=Aeromicrobium phoceense TaxID=2754045 RepID=A0A838XPX0_9ACTN|nr:YbdK family carboxylate-amine ligase [Aeromicrobium phoceense]MBA4609064.1 YbdK family carboxylate-amine ligase [Aeromicrobium phoceense]
MLTVGVEEEFLLLDPAGEVVAAAADVVRRVADDRVKPELMTYQVETATDVCTDLTTLESQLLELRRRVASACDGSGVRLAAVGTPPVGKPGLEFVTDSPRYRALAARFPDAVAGGGTCACQIHVGVPDRDLAVRVLGRLRRWLPTLFSLGTNSPVLGGRDTGWSSTRYVRQLSWPTFAPPEPWSSAEAYDVAVAQLVDRGDAVDARSVYRLARLSPRYPTIEIRVADTCLDAADAAMLAGICRALVTVLASDIEAGRPDLPVSDTALRSALLSVAVDGQLPTTGPEEVTRAVLVTGLIRTILSGLSDSAEIDLVLAGLERIHRYGTGAERQRRLLATSPDLGGFVGAVVAATIEDGATR